MLQLTTSSEDQIKIRYEGALVVLEITSVEGEVTETHLDDREAKDLAFMLNTAF